MPEGLSPAEPFPNEEVVASAFRASHLKARKDSIKSRSITKAAVRAMKSDGLYGGQLAKACANVSRDVNAC